MSKKVSKKEIVLNARVTPYLMQRWQKINEAIRLRDLLESLPEDQQEAAREAFERVEEIETAIGLHEGLFSKTTWSRPNTPTRWAKVFSVSVQTFKRWAKSGKVRVKMHSDRSYSVDIRDIPTGF